jgi:hypothetical protein
MIKLYAMKVYVGVVVYIYVFLTMIPAGGEWSASHTYLYTPKETFRSTPWIGGCVGP